MKLVEARDYDDNNNDDPNNHDECNDSHNNDKNDDGFVVPVFDNMDVPQ